MAERPLSDMIEPGMEESETITPEQLQAMHRAAEAQRAALAQQQQQQQHGGHDHDHEHHHHGHNHSHQGQQMQMQQPGAPTPQGLAVAQWLRSQDLKTRQCVLNHERRDLFKVKRAIRALQSPAYAKASAKNPQLLPPCPDRNAAENVFKLLPLGMLALRVNKVDPAVAHEGHGHAPPKKVKGLWTVEIEPQQEVRDELHFIWLYDGPQVMQKVYAAGALVAIMAVVLFPLWPMKMRLGVWYISMGMLGLIGLFFAMSIFRLILFVVTMFAAPPGLWLYPNLFEDVGFFDSFRPVWAWHEVKGKKGKKAASANGAASSSKKKSSKKGAEAASAPTATATAGGPPAAAATSGAAPTPSSAPRPTQRTFQPMIEEGDDE